MSFYVFKPIVTVFSLTDMATPEPNATERDMEVRRARSARALERIKRYRRRHPPLTAFARNSRRLQEILNELDHIPCDMEPAPPRVHLQSTHRAPFQEPLPLPFFHNYDTVPSGPLSPSGRFSAKTYQPQHILHAQDDGSVQRLQVTLCAVCAAYVDALPRPDHLRVTPPDLEPMPELDASHIED